MITLITKSIFVVGTLIRLIPTIRVSLVYLISPLVPPAHTHGKLNALSIFKSKQLVCLSRHRIANTRLFINFQLLFNKCLFNKIIIKISYILIRTPWTRAFVCRPNIDTNVCTPWRTSYLNVVQTLWRFMFVCE